MTENDRIKRAENLANNTPEASIKYRRRGKWSDLVPATLTLYEKGYTILYAVEKMIEAGLINREDKNRAYESLRKHVCALKKKK